MTTTHQKESQEALTRRMLHTAVMNPVGSKAFLKKIVPVAIASILHQRIELDEANFSTKYYGGIQYNAFKPSMRSPLLREINSWINGAWDALNKNYLREMYLIFESANEAQVGMVHESYKFQFKYMGTKAATLDEQAITKEQLEENTNLMLTAIQSLNSLRTYKEDEIKIKMALTYYEEGITPPNYAPPCFNIERNPTSLLDAVAKQPADYLHLGKLTTGYHSLKCRGKGDLFSIRDYSPTTTIVTIEENTQATESPGTNNTTPEPITESVANSQNSEVYEDYHFNCRCTIAVILKHVDTILCSQCLTYQHCACSGYLIGSDAPDEYVCLECRNSSEEQAPHLRKSLKQSSLFKLSVALAYFTKEVPNELFQLISEENVKYLIEKLQVYQAIFHKNGIYEINMKNVKEVLVPAIFTKKAAQKGKIIPDSMNLEEVKLFKANSVVIEAEQARKRRKYK